MPPATQTTKGFKPAQVGDPVLAIDNPLGLGQTLTTGMVSAWPPRRSGPIDPQMVRETLGPANAVGGIPLHRQRALPSLQPAASPTD